LPYTSVNVLRGSISSVVLMMASTGVMPEPPENATYCWPWSAFRWVKKRPSGVMTSIVWPGCSVSNAKFEKRPPRTRLMPTRSSPSRS